MKEVIGSFTVTNGASQPQIVFVSQKTTVNENNVVIGSKKIFTLNSVDGEAVYRTEDPNTLVLKDGTTLRKTSSVKMKEM